MRIIDANYFFLEIFKAKRGAHYATLNTVYFIFQNITLSITNKK